MAISLYDATVVGFLRNLEAVEGFLQRGLDHCADAGIDPQTLFEASICADMLPLSFQIISVHHHSANALKGAQEGRFTPPDRDGLTDYPSLQRRVADAKAYLQGLSAEAVNQLEGGEVVFEIADRQLPFTTPEFLFAFSIPNFHFHATTAYDLLRLKGVPLGKRDYLGQLPFRRD